MPKRPVTPDEIDRLRSEWEDELSLAQKFIDYCFPPNSRGYQWIDEDVYQVWKSIKRSPPSYSRIHHYRRWFNTELGKIQQLFDLRPNWESIALANQERAAQALINRERNQDRFAPVINLLDSRSANSPFCSDMVSILRNSGEPELDTMFTDRQLEVIIEIWGKHSDTDTLLPVGSEGFNRRVAEFRQRFFSH